MVLQINTLLNNRYKLIERIGSGGFSIVWKALDTHKGDAQVAIKVFLPDKGMDTNVLTVFQEEYQLTHDLNDGRLVKNTDFFIEDYSPCLVMPYMQNGSLYGKITRQGPLSEEEVAKVMYQVAGGLNYLHSQAQPVLHLDIKPDNILIDYSGYYRLADFGISTRTRSSLLRASNQKGETLAYSTPERALSKKVGPYSDIFSFGITIFELCTGEVPWNAEGGKALVLGLPMPELPEEYSRRLNSIMQACLSLEPEKRPGAAELEHLSAAYLDKKYWNALKGLPSKSLTQIIDGSTENLDTGKTKPVQTKGTNELNPQKQKLQEVTTPMAKKTVKNEFLLSPPMLLLIISISIFLVFIIANNHRRPSNDLEEEPTVMEDTTAPAVPADTTAADSSIIVTF
jgi:serine/threonine protein kinase